MDFLLSSLTAGTGGDGMNLGTIENMEVNILEFMHYLNILHGVYENLIFSYINEEL